MAIRSSFFNSVNGDRRYLANNFAEYFASFIANGVFPNPSNGLQVYEKQNMTVVIKPGKGWINGYFAINEYDYELTFDNADGVLNRIDRVVLRLDFTNREITLAVKKGIFASSPVAKTLQRNEDAYEIALADVYIAKGSTSITQSNITDQRLNTALCGIVSGLIKQVDTTTVFNQYLSWFNNLKSDSSSQISQWQTQVKLEFDQWFDSVKDILDGDIATNLATRILTLEQEFSEHKTDVVKHMTSTERENWNKVNNKLDYIDFEAHDSSVKHNTFVNVLNASSSTNKTAVASGFILNTGAIITAKFTNANTAVAPTLNVNGTGAKLIRDVFGSAYANLQASIYTLVYDGAAYVVQDATADVAEGDWQTPILLNGFTKNSVCRYKKTKNTLIIDISVNGVTQGVSVPIFNLPAGYRPLASKNPIFATIGGNATAVRGFVGTSGDVGVSTSIAITGDFVGFTMQATVRLD